MRILVFDADTLAAALALVGQQYASDGPFPSLAAIAIAYRHSADFSGIADLEDVGCSATKLGQRAADTFDCRRPRMWPLLTVPIGPADPLGAATFPYARLSWTPLVTTRRWPSDLRPVAIGTISLTPHSPVHPLTVSRMDSGIPAIATPDIASSRGLGKRPAVLPRDVGHYSCETRTSRTFPIAIA